MTQSEARRRREQAMRERNAKLKATQPVFNAIGAGLKQVTTAVGHEGIEAGVDQLRAALAQGRGLPVGGRLGEHWSATLDAVATLVDALDAGEVEVQAEVDEIAAAIGRFGDALPKKEP